MYWASSLNNNQVSVELCGPQCSDICFVIVEILYESILFIFKLFKTQCHHKLSRDCIALTLSEHLY